MNIEIYDIREQKARLDEIVDYFWKQWGSESNYHFYRDCMEHSCQTDNNLPRFYVAMEDSKIVGSYALLRSDLNSRQDLEPWFACLYVSPELRGRKLGTQLQNHAKDQARIAGYPALYLSTDLDGYYERNEWIAKGHTYLFDGTQTKVYELESSKRVTIS
ncbi:hypothetical protein Back11_16540 [Paenibacillus baekrokdamisoli]|uniref:Uncharacterized protein n=1 Tax=Paenibacillus baekrokdamisoli TaxID=1712516 RepID=A0A3G9JBC7_9BACL|nr:GNAT family N-acetyltransferase [Paenibacillus baekrokdamisoli]MBB3072006.1 GNAT superfamily N-acetyltransferase [Paenibacillus baekrokdamisoli]BBH20309.1 hypothetical protein Back11_16540 [Paenibacillus baekrokdamisoli]